MVDVLKLMPIFVEVVDRGSFTEAARSLQVSRPMVSQYVKDLEDQLGVTLIARTTRALATTEAGSRFYDRCKSVLADARNAIDEVWETQNHPRGRLRIGCPFDLSIGYIPSLLAAYAEKFPDVEIDLVIEDKIESAIQQNLDLTFRVGWLKDSSLYARKISTFELILCASPKLLSKTGLPKKLLDLEAMPWVVLSRLAAGDRWTFAFKQSEQTIYARKKLTCNSSLAVKELVLSGLGVSVCPGYQIESLLETKEVVRLLPKWSIAPGGIWAVYPQGRTPPYKVQKLIELSTKIWKEARLFR